MSWEELLGKKNNEEELRRKQRLNQLANPRPPEGSEIAAQDKEKLDLLEKVAPDAARVFQEAQNPALSGAAFYELLGRFNERPRYDKDGKPTAEVWRGEWAKPGEFHSIRRDIFPGRYVVANFLEDGRSDVTGRDEDHVKAFREKIRKTDEPFWRRWRKK